jgi:hypothetical protein
LFFLFFVFFFFFKNLLWSILLFYLAASFLSGLSGGDRLYTSLSVSGESERLRANREQALGRASAPACGGAQRDHFPSLTFQSQQDEQNNTGAPVSFFT